jgi:hypothetical protein
MDSVTLRLCEARRAERNLDIDSRRRHLLPIRPKRRLRRAP